MHDCNTLAFLGLKGFKPKRETQPLYLLVSHMVSELPVVRRTAASKGSSCNQLEAELSKTMSRLDSLSRDATEAKAKCKEAQAASRQLLFLDTLSRGATEAKAKCKEAQEQLERAEAGCKDEAATATEQLERAEAGRKDEAATASALHTQVVELELEIQKTRGEGGFLTEQLSSLENELSLAVSSRDAWKDTAEQHEARGGELYRSIQEHQSEAAHARCDAQATKTELEGAMARMKLLDSQLQDSESQMSVLSARMAATEKSLQDANSKSVDLNSRLALAETDSRLKVQELLAKVSYAEDTERVNVASLKETIERLERQLRESKIDGTRFQTECDRLRADRLEGAAKVDDVNRQLLELQAKLLDAEHVHQQLHAVMADRDELREGLRQGRNKILQAEEESHWLRQQVGILQQELGAAGSERTLLKAQMEASRLDGIVTSALAKSRNTASALMGQSQARRGELPMQDPGGVGAVGPLPSELQRRMGAAYAVAGGGGSFSGAEIGSAHATPSSSAPLGVMHSPVGRGGSQGNGGGEYASNMSSVMNTPAPVDAATLVAAARAGYERSKRLSDPKPHLLAQQMAGDLEILLIAHQMAGDLEILLIAHQMLAMPLGPARAMTAASSAFTTSTLPCLLHVPPPSLAMPLGPERP
eukprot:gene7938-1152_t